MQTEKPKKCEKNKIFFSFVRNYPQAALVLPQQRTNACTHCLISRLLSIDRSISKLEYCFSDLLPTGKPTGFYLLICSISLYNKADRSQCSSTGPFPDVLYNCQTELFLQTSGPWSYFEVEVNYEQYKPHK